MNSNNTQRSSVFAAFRVSALQSLRVLIYNSMKEILQQIKLYLTAYRRLILYYICSHKNDRRL